jgi:toxin ParE1/3/4
MVKVRWTPQAADDLEAITEFIGQDSEHYASLFVMDVLQAVERLAHLPRIGRVVPEINDPAIREIILGNYRIIYRLHVELVEILTVYHGAKLLDPTKLN